MLDRPPIPWEKALWTFALICVIFPGYYAISLNQDPKQAATMATWIDRAIPFSSAWMFAYGGVYTALLLPVFVVQCDHLFRRVALAYLAVLLASYATFIVYPVTTAGFRPEIATLDTTKFWEWGAAVNYALDPPLNSFPSLHVGTMTLALLVAAQADRVVGAFAAIVWVLISLSTMVVKQHYLADVVAGAGLACVAWFLIVRPYDPARHEKSPEQVRRSRWFVLAYVLLYAFTIFGVLGPLYLMGWKPWERG